ncbi:anti-sigma factor family protein [Methylocella silvestris]|uniref:Anti-sigma factor n=1 Tax=Methylocella silvestris TaxID=199596 RepID=A0A2J7TEX9_METSI|nr:hypothetical protein [Methylocella silvestris]PNG25309.1 hypothetical protein CR492_14255 [Methylocella silvestris]
MNGAPPAIDDEELMAFVDGELSAEQRCAVESYIASSPTAAERVEIWRQQGKALRAAFARVEAEPPAPILVPYRKRALPRLMRSCGSAPPASPANAARSALAEARREPIQGEALPRRAALKTQFALVATFVAGAAAALALVHFSDHLVARQEGLIGRGLPATGADEPIAQRAREALSHFNGGKTTSRDAAAAVTGGGALIVPNLSDAGYALIGARAGQGAGRDRGEEPFCLFYAMQSARPVALCIAAKDDGVASGAAAQMSVSGEAGAAVVSWRQAGARYALAGSLPEGALRDLAGRVSKEVAAFDAR